MAYQIFDSKAVGPGTPKLTIRGEKIAFNADAGELLAKAGVKFAHLLWDADLLRIAIRPAGREDRRAFKLSFRQARRGGTFSARSFLRHIQWRAVGPVTVSAAWNATERMLEASLPGEHIGLSNRTHDSQERVKNRLKGRDSNG